VFADEPKAPQAIPEVLTLDKPWNWHCPIIPVSGSPPEPRRSTKHW